MSSPPRAELFLVAARSTEGPPVPREGLLARLCAGEAAAERETFDLLAPLGRRLLRRTLGATAELDDLLQEAFLRLFRNVRRVRDGEALEPFFVAIVVNVARAELSRRWRRRWLHLGGAQAVASAEGDGHVEVGVDHEARAAVRWLYMALDRQSPEARVLFVLRHVEGMELSAIAAAVGSSLATVKRKLARVSARIFKAAAEAPAVQPYLREGRS